MPTLPACMSRIGDRLTNASPQRALEDAKRRSELRRAGLSTNILLSTAGSSGAGLSGAASAPTIQQHQLQRNNLSRGNSASSLLRPLVLPQPHAMDQLLTTGVAARMFVQKAASDRVPASDVLFYPIQLRLAFVEPQNNTKKGGRGGMELRLCKRARDEAQYVLSFAKDIFWSEMRSRKRPAPSGSGTRTPFFVLF